MEEMKNGERCNFLIKHGAHVLLEKISTLKKKQTKQNKTKSTFGLDFPQQVSFTSKASGNFKWRGGRVVHDFVVVKSLFCFELFVQSFKN